MKKILKTIHQFLFPPLDIKKGDLNLFLDIFKAIGKITPVNSIGEIHHVFSGPIYDENYSDILRELSSYQSLQDYTIEIGDYVAAHYITLSVNHNLLVLLSFTPDFNNKNFFFF